MSVNVPCFNSFRHPYLLALLYHILSFRSWFRFNQRFLRIRLKAQAAFPQIRDGTSCTAHSPWRSGHRASLCRSSDAYPWWILRWSSFQDGTSSCFYSGHMWFQSASPAGLFRFSNRCNPEAQAARPRSAYRRRHKAPWAFARKRQAQTSEWQGSKRAEGKKVFSWLCSFLCIQPHYNPEKKQNQSYISK